MGDSDAKLVAKHGMNNPLNYQLDDMQADAQETKNLVIQNPEVVDRMRKKLQDQIDAGRTTPGANQSNDAEVVIDKWKKKKKK